MKTNKFVIGVFLCLTVLPLVAGMTYALLYSFGVIGLVGNGFTLQYWADALNGQELWYSLGFTFYIATASMLLSVGISLWLTTSLRNQLQRGIPAFALYIPLAFPAIVVAFLVFQLFTQSGLVARMFYQLGLIDQTSGFPDLVNDARGTGIIAAHVFMAVPFLTLYFMNLYKNEQIDAYRQVAQTLGAGRSQQKRRVAIPILLRRGFPTVLLYFVFVLGSYEIPLLLGRQSPQMVSVLIIRKLRKFSLDTIPEAYITALVYIVVVLGLAFYLYRFRKISFDLDE